jgi:HK97 family phage portal protein
MRRIVKSESFSVLLNYYRGQEQLNPKNYEQYIRESYKKNPYAYTAIKIIARCFARVDWLVYEKRNSRIEKRDEIEEHPLIDLLNKPNKYESGFNFRQKWITNLLLTGNTYIEKVDVNKKPKELYLLRPDRVTIIPGTDRSQLIKGYKYKIGGQEYFYDYEKVRHTTLYDPTDDFYGMSPIEAAASSIDLNNLARSWNADTLNNGGQPNILLKTDRKLTQEQKERLEALIRQKALHEKGIPWVLEGGLELQPLQLNAIDMAWTDSSKLSAREIAIVYGVPPEIMGDSANKTYNNYKESRKALYEETIIPHLELFREELNNWIVPMFSDKIEIDFDPDSIEALQEETAALWQKAQTATFITIDEKRNLVGYDDLPNGEGDTILVPANMIPIGDAEASLQGDIQANMDMITNESNVGDNVEQVIPGEQIADNTTN